MAREICKIPFIQAPDPLRTRMNLIIYFRKHNASFSLVNETYP